MKIEIEFEKLPQGTLWMTRIGGDPPATSIIHTSRAKAINYFLTRLKKQVSGETEFTLIGMCGEKGEEK